MEVSDKTGEDLFSSLNYYEAGSISFKAKEILDKAGAKRHTYMSELVKIAITDTTDNVDELSEISDIYDIPVVSCTWVTMSLTCGKLLPTKAFPPVQISSALFKGKCFCACSLSKMDCNAIWAMITFNGGKTKRKITAETTHLISANTTHKYVLISQQYPNIHVVTPDWVTDCIKKDELLDESSYHPINLLTTPVKNQIAYRPNQSDDTSFNMPVAYMQKGLSQSPQNTSLNTLSSQVSSFNIQNQMMINQFRAPQVSTAYPPGTRVPNPSHAPYMQRGISESNMILYNQLPQTSTNYLPTTGSGHSGHRMPRHGMQMVNPAVSGYMNPGPGKHMQHMTRHVSQSINQPPAASLGLNQNSPLVDPPLSKKQLHSSSLTSSNRTSPVGFKTPPIMNIGQMTEVPYPSQVSMPDETPIIRMTNMAAFMKSEQKKSQNENTGVIVPTSVATTNASTGTSHAQSLKPTPAPVSVIKPPVRLHIGSDTSPGKERSPVRYSQPMSLPQQTAAHGSNLVLGSSSNTNASTADNSAPVYFGYDESSDAVPQEMCLIGCIFYMGDYAKMDADICEQWIKAIEQHGGTVDPSYSNRVTHVLVETQASDVCRLALNDHKRVVTAHWLNDVIGKGKMEPPWRAHHIPHPHTPEKLHCANQVIGITGFNKEERIILQTLTKMLGASFTNYLARSNTALVCKRLEGEKVKKAKEWGIVCVNTVWLSELVLGNLRALKLPLDKRFQTFETSGDVFRVDLSIAASVMCGWRVSLKIPKDCWRKFKPSTKTNDALTEGKRKSEDESLTNPLKRTRMQEIQNTRSNLPSGQRPVIMLTGFSQAEKDKYSKMIIKLGGSVTSEAADCTHLIAERIVRTPNFLKAINYCAYVTSAEWISESVKSNHFVDERVFALQNTEHGSMWNILEALERRRVSGKPFSHLLFHITPGVPTSTHLPRKFLVDLIQAAGGKVQDDKRWSVAQIIDAQNVSHNHAKMSYIVVTCKDDVHLCMDLINNNIDVFSVEFILSGVMNQQISYDTILCSKSDE